MQPLYQPTSLCTGVAFTENFHCTNGEAYLGGFRALPPPDAHDKAEPRSDNSDDGGVQ